MCMNCHAMILEDGKRNFGLKEMSIENNYSGKPYGLNIIYDNGVLSGYLYLTSISPSEFRNASLYLYRHTEIKKLIVEIHSTGGSVMGAWRIVGRAQQTAGCARDY